MATKICDCAHASEITGLDALYSHPDDGAVYYNPETKTLVTAGESLQVALNIGPVGLINLGNTLVAIGAQRLKDEYELLPLKTEVPPTKNANENYEIAKIALIAERVRAWQKSNPTKAVGLVTLDSASRVVCKRDDGWCSGYPEDGLNDQASLSAYYDKFFIDLASEDDEGLQRPAPSITRQQKSKLSRPTVHPKPKTRKH